VIGIYVHIPFCAARCRYCDFPTGLYDDDDARRYLRAVGREVEAAADNVGRLRADTLYLGGGTPPVLGRERLGQLLAEVRERFEVSPEAEATCEANPESLAAEVLEAFAAAGLNRLSLGVQTFDDRRHDASGAEEAYWRARAAGVENVSLDLMYGLPGQETAAWERDLARALALKPEHISLYALTLEPTVELYRRRAAYVFPADDEQAEMYHAAAAALAAAGYRQYELSNFARPGRECRHNVRYWQDGEYLGFGPGAASHWSGGRYRNPRELDEYVAAAATGRWPLVDAEPSDPYREMRTAVVLALRLTEGLDAAAFESRFGVNPLEYYREELGPLVAAGLLTVDGDRLRLSPEGRFLADEVFAALI
jgi:oxygen-independent coproporphyrinogen-3 oxidase